MSAGPPPDRRVLMISAAWPPVGRIGARRPLRLARRLPTRGWTPVVLTPAPDAIFRRPPPRDPSLVEPAVEVHRIGAWIPSTRLHRALAKLPAARLTRRVLADALVPDQYPEWTFAAVRAARRIAAEAPIDAVWVTGGPFGIFVVGAAVAAALDRPLVLDYRDPWMAAAPPARRSPLAPPRPLLRAIERRMLHLADGVSAVYPEIIERNRALFGQPAGRPWRVIPNGFDPLDLTGEPRALARPTLVYAGACYGPRSMTPVLEALADALGPGDTGLELRIFGELDPAAVAALDRSPLPGRVTVSGRIPADELAGWLRGARALLLIVGAGHDGAVSGKVFDYLAAARPIIGYGPPDCAAAALVDRCGVGRWTHDHAGLVDALRQVERGAVPYSPVTDEIARYSADAMADATAALLDEVCRTRS